MFHLVKELLRSTPIGPVYTWTLGLLENMFTSAAPPTTNRAEHGRKWAWENCDVIDAKSDHIR